jgi:hypothetical protein
MADVSRRRAHEDARDGLVPVFYVMNFLIHYDDSRGGIGWYELKDGREARLDELLRDAGLDLRIWANHALVGAHEWHGERHVFRVR